MTTKNGGIFKVLASLSHARSKSVSCNVSLVSFFFPFPHHQQLSGMTNYIIYSLQLSFVPFSILTLYNRILRPFMLMTVHCQILPSCTTVSNHTCATWKSSHTEQLCLFFLQNQLYIQVKYCAKLSYLWLLFK